MVCCGSSSLLSQRNSGCFPLSLLELLIKSIRYIVVFWGIVDKKSGDVLCALGW